MQLTGRKLGPSKSAAKGKESKTFSRKSCKAVGGFALKAEDTKKKKIKSYKNMTLFVSTVLYKVYNFLASYHFCHDAVYIMAP